MPFPEGTETGLYFLINDPELVKDFSCVLNGVDFNRQLNEPHVKEIMDVILNGEYGGKYIAPIRVDKVSHVVLDGNHTLEAFRRAWASGSKEMIKIIFVDVPDDADKLHKIVVDINKGTRSWRIDDFSCSQTKLGTPYMIKLKVFAETHPLCITGKKNQKISYRTVGCFLKGGNITNNIMKESLEITGEELEFAEKIYQEIDKMMNVLKYTKNNWFESFIKAWYSIRKDDAVYNKIINNTGFNTFVEHIKELSVDWQLISRKAYWEKMFRTALGVLDTKVNDTHEWEKAE